MAVKNEASMIEKEEEMKEENENEDEEVIRKELIFRK